MNEERLLQLSRAAHCDVEVLAPAGLKYFSYQRTPVEYTLPDGRLFTYFEQTTKAFPMPEKTFRVARVRKSKE